LHTPDYIYHPKFIAIRIVSWRNISLFSSISYIFIFSTLLTRFLLLFDVMFENISVHIIWDFRFTIVTERWRGKSMSEWVSTLDPLQFFLSCLVMCNHLNHLFIFFSLSPLKYFFAFSELLTIRSKKGESTWEKNLERIQKCLGEWEWTRLEFEKWVKVNMKFVITSGMLIMLTVRMKFVRNEMFRARVRLEFEKLIVLLFLLC
jgi:hypothetical protein